MRNNFRIHPVIIPGETYKLRFINTGIVGEFKFVGMAKAFAIFTNKQNEIVRVLYANVRSA
jgi:hypothetical protein